MLIDYLYIDTPWQLDSFLADSPDLIAFDTEFTRRNTYRLIPELLQLATPEQIAIIDLRANLPIKRLRTLFQSDDVVRVAHSVDQDIEALIIIFDMHIGRLQDTQIADCFLRQVDGGKVGYGNLVQTYLDVTIDKSLQASKWNRRPLSEAQLTYAAEDIAYLIDLWRILESRLHDVRRYEWYDEEMSRYLNPSSEDPKLLPGSTKSYLTLDNYSFHFLKELDLWRHREAQQMDKPKNWVLSNSELFQLAKVRKLTDRAMSRVLSDSQINRHRTAIQRLRKSANKQATGNQFIPFKRIGDSVLELTSRCQAIARDLSIAKDLLASSKDILFAVRSVMLEDRLPIWFGRWREELIGDDIISTANSLKLEN